MVSPSELLKALHLGKSKTGLLMAPNDENVELASIAKKRDLKLVNHGLRNFNLSNIDYNTSLDLKLNQLILESVHQIPACDSNISQPFDRGLESSADEGLETSLVRLKRLQLDEIRIPSVSFENLSDFQINYIKILLAYNKLIELILEKNSELVIFNKNKECLVNSLLESLVYEKPWDESKPDIDFDSTSSV